MGQAAVGDLFAWFAHHAVPPTYHAAAAERGVSIQELLTARAAGLGPGNSGLLALDWWQGNRSTLGQWDLAGFSSAPLSIRERRTYFHAVVEATAFGTRAIIESYTDQLLPVASIVAGGGLTQTPC